jgi:hypothetical protein
MALASVGDDIASRCHSLIEGVQMMILRFELMDSILDPFASNYYSWWPRFRKASLVGHCGSPFNLSRKIVLATSIWFCWLLAAFLMPWVVLLGQRHAIVVVGVPIPNAIERCYVFGSDLVQTLGFVIWGLGESFVGLGLCRRWWHATHRLEGVTGRPPLLWFLKFY